MTSLASPTASHARPRTLPRRPQRISGVPYLPGLDGMRALAVIAVMIYHANSSWLPGGFLGVEMFFVISGYLITLLLIAEREREGHISLRAFWIRRARRLLPALGVLFILLTVWMALFERDALGQVRGDLISSTFYVTNWYQIWVGLGYTSAADFAPLRHLWSLAVEEQFYLVWPIVMVLLLGHRGTRRVASVSRWLFGAAIAITVLVALLYHPGPIGSPETTPEAYWWIGERPISKVDTLYLSTVTRAGGLLLGAAFAMVWRPLAIVRGPLRRRGRSFDVVAAVSLVGFGWLCWNVHLIVPTGVADSDLFRGGLFLSSVSTLLIIAAVTHQGAGANRVLGLPPLVWIGTRSYGLYLFHWPIYQIIRNVAGNKLTLHEFLLAMVATVIITELSYRLVETPVRKGTFVDNLRRIGPRANPRHGATVIATAALGAALSLFAVASVVTAELKLNDIAVSLDEGESATVDLASLGGRAPEIADTEVGPPTVSTVARAPSNDETFIPTPANGTSPNDVAPTTVDGAPPTTALAVPGTTIGVLVPASTSPPPPPVRQLGVVNDVDNIEPLDLPIVPGLPLVALGDSVMQGAATRLQQAGFIVDAEKSRQVKTFLPDLQVIRDSGVLGAVVVVHLGTNGPITDESVAELMRLLADVPVVVAMTGKGDRDWISGNNERIRLLPTGHENVTVLDWQVLAERCPGSCFYDDGIHLTPDGQTYYTGLLIRLLGLE